MPKLSPGSVSVGEKKTHRFEGAVAGKAVGVQRFGTVLSRWDQLVQNFAGVLIVTTAKLLQAGDLHPETRHLLLHGHIHLQKKEVRVQKD